MGWVEGEFTFEEKTSVRDMMYEIMDCFEGERGRNEPMHQEMVLLNKSFDCLEDADDYIHSQFKLGKYYRKNNVGVKFKDYTLVAPTKKTQVLKTRIKETEDKIVNYSKKHAISTFKADFIGCPGCKSKLKRDLLRTHRCPVCNEDMRSETTKKTLNGYHIKIKELNKELTAELKKQATKAKFKWRIYAQAYLG